jgi:lipid A disaccharide synthetase
LRIQYNQLKCKNFALPNIISNKQIVPEHLVSEVYPCKVLEDTLMLWNETQIRKECLENLSKLQEKLKQPGASEKAAKAIIQLLTKLG